MHAMFNKRQSCLGQCPDDVRPGTVVSLFDVVVDLRVVSSMVLLRHNRYLRWESAGAMCKSEKYMREYQADGI